MVWNLIVAFLLAITNAMLMNNVTLSRFYGVCPFLGVSKKSSSALGMGAAVTFVIVLAAAICWPIYQLLDYCDIAYMDTITYILVIASIVQLVEMFIKTNCAVLGVAQGNSSQGLNFAQSMAEAIGTGLGFALVIFIFSCIRYRLDASNVPKAFKGIPIALATAALMSLAFLGLSGMIG